MMNSWDDLCEDSAARPRGSSNLSSGLPRFTEGLNLSSKEPLISSDSGFLSGAVSEDLSQSFDNLNLSSPSTNNLSSQTETTETSEKKTTKFSLEDLIRPDEDGDTPLHLAVLQGFIEVVFALVRVLPHPCLLDIPNNKLQTPLHLAVLTNQPPLVRRLVVGGASVECGDRNGNTPLHLASREGHVDCVKNLCFPVSTEEREAALLRHNFPPQPLPQDLEQRNYDGQMCLHLAAMNGHLNVVQHLCWYNADVNATEGKSGRTALHYAVERRQPALLHFLVTQCGALIDAENYSGYSAYQMAAATAPMLAALLANLGAQRRALPEDGSSETDDSGDSDQEVGDLLQWRSNQGQLLSGFGQSLHTVP